MTYEPWKLDSYLIRFEHILEKDEDSQLSQPVTFNLSRVFPGNFKFTEVTLAANQWFDKKADRLKFKHQMARNVNSIAPKATQSQKFSNDLEVTLRPMEIRTFVMEAKSKANKLLPSVGLLIILFKHFLN